MESKLKGKQKKKHFEVKEKQKNMRTLPEVNNFGF